MKFVLFFVVKNKKPKCRIRSLENLIHIILNNLKLNHRLKLSQRSFPKTFILTTLFQLQSLDRCFLSIFRY